jgi:hypothetical protein
MWFDFGDTPPADDRSGYLHTAQGQVRLVSFSRDEFIWARAVEQATDVILVSGELAATTQANSATVYSLYSELPNPATQEVGTFGLVSNDPTDNLNGLHVVLGAANGANGTYWQAAT